MDRLAVNKTWKMYVGGEFIRSESGITYPVHEPRARRASTVKTNGDSRFGNLIANACRAGRKDLRNAVEAADKAAGAWARRSPFNRGQILYRFSEMLEGRREEMAYELRRATGKGAAAARKEVAAAIDRCVYYAGWADKFAQVLASANPVAGPYFNFTLSEPMGVVGIIGGDDAPLLGLLSQLLPAIVSGNVAVALASEKFPGSSALLGEIIAVSDVPGGVVNLLTGFRKELAPTFATHEQIRALDFVLPQPEAKAVVEAAAESIKRCHWREPVKDEQWFAPEAQSVYEIRRFIEFKTVWHPNLV